ncbi:ABC transporter permease [Virgibacillus siamensis]|uniref:ABC transporter permease n=1 Tax=Virgibacillus siamensis TaxID=480071 RepID=UPI00098481C7|nr:ABC transporter permease [Virgibacillus siamensis]
MFLAIRELMHAKFRYILIGVIMILVAGLIFIISGLAKGLSYDNASAIITMDTDYLVIEEGVENQLTQSSLSKSITDDISSAEGVQKTESLAIKMGAITEKGSDKTTDATLFMTNLDGGIVPTVTEGQMPSDSNEVLADDQLKNEGISIGDQITFNGMKHEYTVSGFVSNQRYSHTSVIYMENKSDHINAVAIQGNANADQQLEQKYDVLTKDEVLAGLPSYSQEQASLNMMIIFLYVIAAFVLAVFFYVITLQKKAQFGVLKALGAKTSYLMRSLLGQVVILSVVCIGAAAAMTVGVGALLPEDMPFVLSSDRILQSAVLLLAVSVIGSLISLSQVVKIDPKEAIEGGAQ